MCQFGSASQFAAQQNLRRRSITTFWAFLIIQGKQRSLSIQQSESHIKDEARVIKLCNDGHMGNTLYCPTTRKIGPFVLDFTVCLVYEKNTWSLFLPLAVVVIQKSITFIDYVKGGQLPRMLHFVYRVLYVLLQERGQTVSFFSYNLSSSSYSLKRVKRITRAQRARNIFSNFRHCPSKISKQPKQDLQILMLIITISRCPFLQA